MAPRISKQTTKFLHSLHGILDEKENDLLVWVSDSEWIITDKKEFVNNQVQRLFGLSKGELFYRKLRGCSFVVNMKRGTGNGNEKQTVTVQCPPDFRRHQHHRCSEIRSVRPDAPKPISATETVPTKPCICQCCVFRGLDGNHRVWFADLMCDDCTDYWADLQTNGTGTTEEYSRVEQLFLSHLAKTEYR